MKATFPVSGMSCASCAQSIESMLKSSKGVNAANVNYANSTVFIDWEKEILSEKDIQLIVQSIGYDILIDQHGKSLDREKLESLENKKLNTLKMQVLFSGLFSIPLFIIAMFFMDIPYGNYVQWILATPVIFVFGNAFFRRAWKNLKHRQANMDTLVSLSTGTAYLFSVFNTVYPEFWHKKGIHPHIYFESTAIIIFFILIGKYLEEKAKKGTGDAIKKLMQLQVKNAHLKNGSDITEIATESIRSGMILLVKPGELIPADGEVVAGESYVDESSINGEPLPTLKTKNSLVFTGTINQKGSLEMEVKKSGNETLLARIIQAVQIAQGSKAPMQKLADKIAGIFVPVVIIISIITLIFWVVFAHQNGISQGILSMVTVLIIACPCALGLATPTALTTGVGKGALNGILIKDAEALELAAKMDVLILDKTGTITEGKPRVAEIKHTTEKANKYLPVLLAMEEKSEHPIGYAVTEYLKKEDVKTADISNFQSITGKGVKCQWEENVFLAGNAIFMRENGISQIQNPKDNQDERTILFFAKDGEIISVIYIEDTIRKNIPEMVNELRKNKGIEVYLLSGDREASTAKTAAIIAATGFRGDMLPGDKAAFIAEMQKQGKIVGMAGDGVNDSQALATADIGFAMARGSEISLDVAGITLAGSNPAQILKAIKLSKATIRNIKQNLFWAFIYNLIGIPLAAGLLYPFNGFLLNPMIAGAAMALSSISVVTNSLRLKFLKLEDRH